MSKLLGLKSDTVKDFYPMADGIFIRHACDMNKKDPFVEGLRRIFEARPELKPSTISVAAGLDDSTVRKLLSGANSSPRVETAQRIAEQIGLHLSDIIAIGEHENPTNAVVTLFSLRDVSPEVREEAVKYAKYLQAQQLAYEVGKSPTVNPTPEGKRPRRIPEETDSPDQADDSQPLPKPRSRNAS